MKTLIFSLILCCGNVYGQQLYEYYYGYKQGFREGCGCSNEPPRSREMMYKSGYKQDGYNAGYIDGRIFLNQNSSNKQDNTQIAQPDFALIQQVMAQKQALLDQRRQTIQQEYDEIVNIAIAMVKKRTPPVATQAENDYLNKVGELASKYGNYDLTNTTTYNQIIAWMEDQKRVVLTW